MVEELTRLVLSDGWDPDGVTQALARKKRDTALMRAAARHCPPDEPLRWDMDREWTFSDSEKR